MKKMIICLLAFAFVCCADAADLIACGKMDAIENGKIIAVGSPRVVPTGIPAFKGESVSAIAHVEFEAAQDGRADVSLTIGNPEDVKALRLGGIVGSGSNPSDGVVQFSVSARKGLNRLPLTVELSSGASVSRRLGISGVKFRVGSVVARPGQEISDARAADGSLRRSKFFRIPGIVKTPTGALVSAFDVRYDNLNDLPNDITVGVSRSTDGGNTWSPIVTAIDWRGLPGGKGVGDPAILVDPSNGRLWIMAVRQIEEPKTSMIWTSRSGTLSPGREGCGQLYLVCSDDDGRTWSPVRNVTAELKRFGDADTKAWGVVFQGPGAGFALKDGTLVFPAQCWGDRGAKFAGGSGRRGLLFYSKDHGVTWTSSKEMTLGGSEATGVQLADGSVWMNVREGAPGMRPSAVTRDLGETWEAYGEPLRGQPVCQAAALRMGGRIYFSSPLHAQRRNMTLRASNDEGLNWSKGLCYDPRLCCGYSSLCPVDEKNIGVFYEGVCEGVMGALYFLVVPTDEVK